MRVVVCCVRVRCRLCLRLRASLALLALLPALALAIPRDAQQRAAFRKEVPCPSNGLRSGRCPGYQIDHVTALMNGGEDHPRNMQWLPKAEHRAKTRADFAACRALADACLYRAKHRRARPE